MLMQVGNNRLETKTANSRKKLVASKVGRANAVRSDVVMVRLILISGEYSDSDAILSKENVSSKQVLSYNTMAVWKIRAIHTGAGRTMHGSVVAHDIKRIYLHDT